MGNSKHKTKGVSSLDEKINLSARSVHVDEERFSEKHENISSSDGVHNEVELSIEPLDTIKNIAIKETDNSPEHKFHAGLACLNGIDIEVDRERAVTLITSAAESGLVEAMRQLVVMYEKGESVVVDHKRALNWRHKIMNILFDKFKQEETVESFVAYFQETVSYICILTDFDGSKPYVYGASKILEDCLSLIRELENRRHNYFKDRTIDFKELAKSLDNDEMTQTLIESRKTLRVLGGKFLPNTWRTYRELIDSKKDENSPSQATVRYLLSICSEYAGNSIESLQYRAEAERILMKVSAGNNQSIEELRSRCFIDLM